uniref:Uncharacterized protein n=1 Tax=Setaria italica TaxID=4555 RepID=K3XP86_SETIT
MLNLQTTAGSRPPGRRHEHVDACGSRDLVTLASDPGSARFTFSQSLVSYSHV